MNSIRQATRADLPALEEIVRRHAGPQSLLHRPFVEHYYFGNPFCQLTVAEAPGEGIVAMMGCERMQFDHRGTVMPCSYGTNWFAFRRGHGIRLYRRNIRSSPSGLVFGGSQNAHSILRRAGWRYVAVHMVHFNRPRLPRAGEGGLRRLAKSVLNRFERRLPEPTGAVTETRSYSEDLLPRASPFVIRFAPSVEHLRWRYACDLSFARYRLFRTERTRGYVILQEFADRVLVAQCDAEDPILLAHAVVDALAGVLGRRHAVLSCSHARMLKVFLAAGFRQGESRPLALSGAAKEAWSRDPSDWLVNFGWGDNGLRAPFLDQA